MTVFRIIFPILFFWGVVVFVVINVSYPESLIHANSFQLLSFFIPLFLALTFSFNSFLKNIFMSGSISLGVITMLILKSLDNLNLITGILSVIVVALLVSYFKKTKRSGLTNQAKIPTLTRLRR